MFVITADLADPACQAYLLLRNAFTVALILAGADKFLSAMIDWVQYLAPVVPRTVGIPPEIFLRGVGIVEIGLLAGTHFDVALRDFALLLGALALGRLASGVHRWHEQHA